MFVKPTGIKITIINEKKSFYPVAWEIASPCHIERGGFCFMWKVASPYK